MQSEFPFLKQDITYLDTAASAQKPESVLTAIKQFYEEEYANVHRGIHTLAERATIAFEDARQTIAKFINTDAKQVIFTSGTTHSINTVAARIPLQQGDVILLTELDHHSNIVPWQERAKQVGAIIKWIPVKDAQLDYDQARKIIEENAVKIVAINHISNVTGSVQDIKLLAQLVHNNNGYIIVDGAQALPHMPVDVQELGVDAYAFSGHKMYGPTGIGVLWLSKKMLSALPPYLYGGEMIDQVKKEGSTWASPPFKFEAGTPPIAQAVGLAKAVEFIAANKDAVAKEQDLVAYAIKQLQQNSKIHIISSTNTKCLVTFNLDGIHAHDVAEFLNTKHIAIRAGHHCTQIFHDTLGIVASCRASFGMYNTKEDVDKLAQALKECVEAFNV